MDLDIDPSVIEDLFSDERSATTTHIYSAVSSRRKMASQVMDV